MQMALYQASPNGAPEGRPSQGFRLGSMAVPAWGALARGLPSTLEGLAVLPYWERLARGCSSMGVSVVESDTHVVCTKETRFRRFCSW
jgi:hypothetical protein